MDTDKEQVTTDNKERVEKMTSLDDKKSIDLSDIQK